MVGATTAAAAFMDVALADAGLAAEEVSTAAVASEAATVVSTAEAVSAAAVDSTEAPAGFMVEVAVVSTAAPVDFTAAVGEVSTVEAAGPMVVVEDTAVGTGKASHQ